MIIQMEKIAIEETTEESLVPVLSGDYIAGFVDGEGCFALKFIREVKHNRKNSPEYFYWDAEFAIVLRADDINILFSIQKTLGCGNVNRSLVSNMARYSVHVIDQLQDIIIPFFDKYPLKAKKRLDFNLWREAIAILIKNQQREVIRGAHQKGFAKVQWKEKDIEGIMKIHEAMKPIKSKRNKWKWIDRAKDTLETPTSPAFPV